ncbi:flagellin lysine-N-methylase [Bacillus sp. FDAARGOS_1420]|uniref:flagellin lysine-N-methylase n=1 Tax=unclassified Bacillus (in: firmicutes) TaxID=185979 RepID=UPI001C5A8BFD|nr:flagellin lysine-N-methylase [Bacillus sp. FDAARGOS_1420]
MKEEQCPFLTKDYLCKIHNHYGPERLCSTCQTYPRMGKQINQKYYQTGQLSCPELTRLILLSPIIPKWINEKENKLFFTQQHIKK